MARARTLKTFAFTLFFTFVFALPTRAEIMAHEPQLKLGIGDRPGVMFVMLHNKGAATDLVAAESAAFERIELHTHEHGAYGRMRMVPVELFAVPAQGMLTLQPGGDHLMLFGYRGAAGEKIDVTLKFADGRSLALSVAPEARKKKSRKMNMGGHKHHGGY